MKKILIGCVIASIVAMPSVSHSQAFPDIIPNPIEFNEGVPIYDDGPVNITKTGATDIYIIPDVLETCPSHGTATEVENKIYEFEYGKGGVIDMKTEINIDGQCFRLKFDDKSIEEFKDSVTLSDTHLESIKVELEKTLENDRKILAGMEEDIAHRNNEDMHNLEYIIQDKEILVEHIKKKEEIIAFIASNKDKLTLHSNEFINLLGTLVMMPIKIEAINLPDFVWNFAVNSHFVESIVFWPIIGDPYPVHPEIPVPIIEDRPPIEEVYRLRETFRKLFHKSYLNNETLPKLNIDKNMKSGDHYVNYQVCRPPRPLKPLKEAYQIDIPR